MGRTKTKQKDGGAGTARNLEVIRAERERLAEARSRIANEVAEAEEAIATGAAEEQRQQEEALRKGYPAKPHKPLKEAKERRENLLGQLPTIERLEARLTFEELELQRAELQEHRSGPIAEKLTAATEKFKEAEAALQEARNESHAAREQERSLRERLTHARNRLLALDSEYAAREQAAYEERAAKIEAAHNDPAYRAEREKQVARASGQIILESPEEERRLREAAAKDPGTDVMVGPPSRERGW